MIGLTKNVCTWLDTSSESSIAPLLTKNIGDDWETLHISGYSDAFVDNPREEGNVLVLQSPLGSIMPPGWESSKMTDATTSLAEAEAVQWSKCANNWPRIASVADSLRDMQTAKP